jgi:transcriptional regulator with XRE-family HTH domain
VKDLLVLLGKRVHELRVGRKWSQEEFAHVSGLHRTYIGQIERGEKNISFANLVKISGVLGVAMSELLAGLETDGGRGKELAPRTDPGDRRSTRFAVETSRLLRRFKFQRAAMDRTMTLLEEAITPSSSRNAIKKRSARK